MNMTERRDIGRSGSLMLDDLAIRADTACAKWRAALQEVAISLEDSCNRLQQSRLTKQVTARLLADSRASLKRTRHVDATKHAR